MDLLPIPPGSPAQWQKLHLFPLPASPLLLFIGTENNTWQHIKLYRGRGEKHRVGMVTLGAVKSENKNGEV